MLGYSAAEVIERLTPADISDPQEVFARASSLSMEFATPIAPAFEALAFKATCGVEDSYELTYIRKDGSRLPAVVSVTALRDALDAVIGYLFNSTDNSLRKPSEEALLKTGALQNAIFNSANFSSIATDAKGVIQIFNVGAERMLGYTAADVMNKITPADISDPQEVIARAKALSVELGTPITPGFEALVFKASRGIEDIYELTYIRKDGSRFPAVVSVTALRDAQDAIIGYLLIGTDNTARKQAEEALLKAGALQSAIFNSANFSSIATDAKGVIQIFNVGAERMLGYTAAEVVNTITPADISDPQELIARAEGAERRARHADHARLRGAGVQGLARHRGHLRADLHPQGRQPVPRGGLGHGAARRAGRHHRLPADRHRQHRAPAGGGGAAQARPAAARPAFLHALADRIQHRRADDHRPARHHHRHQQADGDADRLHARRADRRAVQELLHRSGACRGRHQAGADRRQGHQLRADRARPGRHADRGVLQRDHLPRPRPEPAGRVRRGARRDRAQALRADAAAEERRARRRQPDEVRVPRQHVARAAHAAQRHHRLLRGAQATA